MREDFNNSYRLAVTKLTSGATPLTSLASMMHVTTSYNKLQQVTK